MHDSSTWFSPSPLLLDTDSGNFQTGGDYGVYNGKGRVFAPDVCDQLDLSHLTPGLLLQT